MNTKNQIGQKLFKLDYSRKNHNILSDKDNLRKLIGILGVLLPIVLYLFLYIDTDLLTPLESISHYYFTRACGVLVITVGTLALFLLVYKGEAPIDFYISFIAGIGAICLLLFPTNNISACGDPLNPHSVTVLKISDFRVGFHYASAGIFLLCLAVMSIFLFTKSDKSVKERTKEKKIRNRIYRTCGAIMILALALIFARLLKLNIIPADFYDSHQLTFWLEVIAVESFGVSWLIKAEVVLKDNSK